MDEFYKVETEDGEEIETVKREEYEAAKAELDALKAEKEALAKKVEAEADKDKNFSKLKKKNEEEKSELQKKVDELAGQLDQFKTSTVSGVKEKMLNEIAGDDEDIKKKILVEYDGFSGEVTTEDQIKTRLMKAAKLVAEDKNSFYSAVSSSGSAGKRESAKKSESPESVEIRKIMKIDDATAKKYRVNDWKPKY